MKILVVGGGGREHAIIRALKKSPRCSEIWCAPGNGGISYDAHCKAIPATDVDAMVKFAKEEAFDYVVVAQDDPLALGMVDALAAVGIPAFGPDKAAARIEASKVFSKDLMKKYGIPTAKYETFDDPEKVMDYIKAEGKYPVVIKADGLALGKASSALMMKFIIYQFVLTVYSGVTLIWKFSEFSAQVSGLSWLVLVGFGVNLAVILGLLAVCFASPKAKALGNWLIGKLARMGLVKDEAAARAFWEKELDSFYQSFRSMGKSRGLVVQMALLSAVQLTCFFLVPYGIFRSFGAAFGLGKGSAFSMLAAEAFVLNVSSFVPLPGASGGAELSFHAMFAMFFPSACLGISVLLWRLFTFYLPILAGLGFVSRFRRENAGGEPGGPDAPSREPDPQAVRLRLSAPRGKQPDRIQA